MAAIVLERTVRCQSDVCNLWKVLTDTERLNRAIGNHRVDLTPLNDSTAARYLARTSLGGFNVAYEERPYEWAYLKHFHIFRRMRNGPITSLIVRWDLVPADDGSTTVKITMTLEPRFALLGPVIRLSSGRGISRIETDLRAVDAALASGALVPPLPPKHRPQAAALARSATALRVADKSPLAERLITLIAEGADLDISRLRPFALADEWRVDRRDLLSTCLHAVKSGLLELRWDIVCPSCRTVSSSLPSLSDLSEHGACQLCELQFDLNLDEAVEATFAPASNVRVVDAGPYCIGGPARTPHVFAQAILPPGASATLLAPMERGRYRLFIRGGGVRMVELASGGPQKVDVAVETPDGEKLTLSPGGELVVANATSTERHAKLERLEWISQAATARIVTALPAFRRDFSSDTLRPGSSLKVSRMGLFFSDLTDSTKLYSVTGDAAAFKLVQDHFDVVIPILERHRGSMVKTIGDAVMAVFADEMDGVRASLDVLREFDTFRAGHPDRMRTHIKLGFFAGPCFALTANGVLDYFGQTVNIAARLQGQAHSGELVIESELADRAIAEKVLSPDRVVERYRAELKGVDRELEAARIA